VIHYVLGFLFNDEGKQVVMIRKSNGRQVGQLNGIGGKKEADEPPFFAMVREFEEETGVVVEDWTHYGKIEGPTWTVDLYKCFNTDLFNRVQANHEIEEGVIKKKYVNELTLYECVDNTEAFIILANSRVSNALLTYG
jgi:8-oxo-dGTP pyrophosphatase MutT (NUDIX family)